MFATISWIACDGTRHPFPLVFHFIPESEVTHRATRWKTTDYTDFTDWNQIDPQLLTNSK